MRILTICVLMMVSVPALSQTTWVMDVHVLGGCNCADGERSNNMYVQWNGVTKDNLSTFPPTPWEGDLYFQIESTTGAFNGTIYMYGQGDCYPSNGDPSTQGGAGSWAFPINHSAGAGCQFYGGFPPPNPDYNLSLEVYVYPKFNDLEVTDTGCESGSVVIEQSAIGPYNWYISQNTVSWTLVPGQTSNTLTVTPAVLTSAGFSSGVVYARVSDPSCSYRGTVETGSFTVYAKKPGVSASPTPMSCNTGSDGKITASIVNPDPSVNLFIVRLFHDSDDVDSAIPIDTKNTSGGPVEFTGLPSPDDANRFYKVTVTNNTNPTYFGTCRSDPTPTIEITKPGPMTVGHLGTANVTCNPANTGPTNNGSIQVSISNGTPNFSFSYKRNNGTETSITPSSSSTTTPSFTGLIEGTYQFRVTNDGNGCNSAFSSDISVTQPAALTASGTPADNDHITCKGQSTGAIDVHISGGNGSYIYAWTGPSGFTSGTQDPTGLYAGNYSLALSDTDGCATNSAYTTSITEPATGLGVTGTPSVNGAYNVSCANNDGYITISYTNQSHDIDTYEWRRDGLPMATPPDPENPVNLSAAEYYVRVVDDEGCDASTTIDLSGNPGITAVASATSDFNGYDTKCNSPTSTEGEGTVVVTGATGLVTYQWSSHPTDQSQNVTNLAPGSYTVSVNDAAFCSTTATLVIQPPPAIVPNALVTSNYNGAQVSCPGEDDGRITASPSNGQAPYTYDWAHDAGLNSNIANGLSEGDYTVTVTDNFGCFAEQTVTVNDPAKIRFIFNKTSHNGSDLSCYGESDGGIQPTIINALGSPATFIYEWDNGATTKDISGLIKGDYKFTVTDGNGCVKDSTATIIEPAELLVTLPHINDLNTFDISCFGLSDGEARADATGGTGAYSYAWSNGINVRDNLLLPANTYSVIVRDANLCEASGSITLTQPPLLVISANVDNPVSCFGLSDGQVTLTASGGAPGYDYSMDASSWDTEATFSGLLTGNHNFYLQDDNGCQANTTAFIAQPDVLQLSFADRVDAECNEPTGSIRAVVLGGNGGYQYQWLDETTSTPMNTGEQLLNAVAGIYRVNVLDSKSCDITDLTSISSIGGAVVTIDNITPVTCFGFSDGSALMVVTSGSGPYGYSWSDGQLTDQAVDLSAGRYFATVEDSYGCKTIEEVIIETPDVLSVVHTKTLPLCVGDCNGIIQSNAAGGTAPYSYEWVDLGNLTNEATNLCAGTFALKITDDNSCILEEDVVLLDPATLIVNAQVTDPTCLGRCNAMIVASGAGGTGPYTYDWGDLGTSNTLNNLCPADYHVVMKDSHDCPAENTFTVNEGNPLPLDLGTLATLCVGQSKELDAGSQWVIAAWTSSIGFTSTESRVTITVPGDYFFEGTDALGCMALDTFHLETSLDLLNAEFLMPATASVGDTIVAIDISWPLPERIEWDYPESLEPIDAPIPDMLYVKATEEGRYTIAMRSFLAQCQDLREKTLIVSAVTGEESEGRFGPDELILDFSMSPNPNDGRFSAHVELSQEAAIKLRVLQHTTGIVVVESDQPAAKDHAVEFDLSSLAPSTYVLLLTVNDTQRFIRFIKL